MIPQYDHTLIASFMQWLDYSLLTKGVAYTNTNSILYPTQDSQFPNMSIYASPFKSWIADFGISGANVPTGVYVGNSFIGIGQSGLQIDYVNGRALFSAPVNGTVSGYFAIKDINIYYSNETDEELLFQSKFHLNPNTFEELNALPVNAKTFPCMYLKYYEGQNVPFSFGGQDQNLVEFKGILITDSNYLMEGACSILRDAARTNFAYLNPGEFQFNPFGGMLTGYYNYKSIGFNKTPNQLIFIENVRVTKNSERVSLTTNQKAFSALIEFGIRLVRFPRFNGF